MIYDTLFTTLLSQQEHLSALSLQHRMTYVMKIKRQYAKEHGLAQVPTNSDLLQAYRQACSQGHMAPSAFLEKILTKRAIRSQSGIVSVQVLTKPFWCPGKCIFCPNDATMPKSYINTEPGAMRALLHQFDPYKQVYNRLLSLYLTGHQTDKIEMIVLGGTRDVYPASYKERFLKGLYDACNTFEQFLATTEGTKNIKMISYEPESLGVHYPASIQESMDINETATHRIIGLTIETRPEYMTDENCRLRRTRGVTRLEMGLQSTFDDVLDANKRGHTVQQARDAVHKMRQYGFKFSIHFMPGLYGSSYEKDVATFVQAYSDIWLKPDEIKLYPTSVIPNTELYELYKKGLYIPLEGEKLKELIITIQHTIIPPYSRVKRLIRDIPATEIAAGNDITNLRQLIDNQMQQLYTENQEKRKELYSRLYPEYTVYTSQDDMLAALSSRTQSNTLSSSQTDMRETTDIIGIAPDCVSSRSFTALDTRSREMRQRKEGEPVFINTVCRSYRSSVGDEFFLSMEDELGYIYGFARLLLPDVSHTIAREGLGKHTALIRELHVYGNVAKIAIASQASSETAQHKGFGGRLLERAERIAQTQGYTAMSVISGIGVRQYYQKRGYRKVGTYMVKTREEIA